MDDLAWVFDSDQSLARLVGIFTHDDVGTAEDNGGAVDEAGVGVQGVGLPPFPRLGVGVVGGGELPEHTRVVVGEEKKGGPGGGNNPFSIQMFRSNKPKE